jgi:hypothetical protein
MALPTLLAATALISMINLEADLAYLLVNLWQALIATLMFFVPFRILSRGGNDTRPIEPWRRLDISGRPQSGATS